MACIYISGQNDTACTKESAMPTDHLKDWKESVLIPTLAGYSPQDIYNGDEKALFYKSFTFNLHI